MASSDKLGAFLDLLRADHIALIGLGQAYGSFDAAGKLIFLDKMADIAERWKVLMSLVGSLGLLRVQGICWRNFV